MFDSRILGEDFGGSPRMRRLRAALSVAVSFALRSTIPACDLNADVDQVLPAPAVMMFWL